MNAILRQFRRVYSDFGENDVDFSDHEMKLRAANLKLANATQALVRASEHLNDVVLANGFNLDKNDIN